MRKAACLLMLVAGCGGVGAAVSGEVGRTVVTQELREACIEEGWWRTDAEIRSELIILNDFRIEGFSRAQEMEIVRNSCLSLDFLVSPCLTCEVILVDHVYR